MDDLFFILNDSWADDSSNSSMVSTETLACSAVGVLQTQRSSAHGIRTAVSKVEPESSGKLRSSLLLI